MNRRRLPPPPPDVDPLADAELHGLVVFADTGLPVSGGIVQCACTVEHDTIRRNTSPRDRTRQTDTRFAPITRLFPGAEIQADGTFVLQVQSSARIQRVDLSTLALRSARGPELPPARARARQALRRARLAAAHRGRPRLRDHGPRRRRRQRRADRRRARRDGGELGPARPRRHRRERPLRARGHGPARSGQAREPDLQPRRFPAHRARVAAGRPPSERAATGAATSARPLDLRQVARPARLSRLGHAGLDVDELASRASAWSPSRAASAPGCAASSASRRCPRART